MVEIREVETQLATLFADGKIPGFLHLSIGQEAVAAGIASVLTNDDTLASTHRGHGHCIAKGIDLVAFFAELFGKATGACKGRGGSMHVADMKVGMLGANGIVGAGMPIALGSALSHKLKAEGAIAVAFFGDGAQAEGSLHETLNLAATWQVPLLLVCEDNGWSEFTPTHRAFQGVLKALADAFKLKYGEADGNDVEAVTKIAAEFVGAMRTERKPAVLRFLTHRVDGHFAGDPQRYRSDEDKKHASERDPLGLCRERLAAAGLGGDEIAAITSEVVASVGQAVSAAMDAPEAVPDFAEWRSQVYANAAHG